MDKALELFVTVYKNIYGFTVVVGDDAYEMNSEASAPNGVNMYIGKAAELTLDETEKVGLSEMTESTKRAIASRIYEDVIFANKTED